MSTTLVRQDDDEAPLVPIKHSDVILTEEDMEEARASWPDKDPKLQAQYMKSRIVARHNHQVRLPGGRRAFGGPQPNSGPKSTKRVGQAVLEAAETRTKEIVDGIFAPLAKDSGSSAMERSKTGLAIAKLAREERALELQEDKFTLQTAEEIRDQGADVLVELIMKGEIDLDKIAAVVEKKTAEAEIVDATVVEDSPRA